MLWWKIPGGEEKEEPQPLTRNRAALVQDLLELLLLKLGVSRGTAQPVRDRFRTRS